MQECNSYTENEEISATNVDHDIFSDQFEHNGNNGNTSSQCINKYEQVSNAAKNVVLHNEIDNEKMLQYMESLSTIVIDNRIEDEAAATTMIGGNDNNNANLLCDHSSKTKQISDKAENTEIHHETTVNDANTSHFNNDHYTATEDYTVEDETAAISNISGRIFDGLNMKGRRIVDVNYLLQSFVNLYIKHSVSKCCKVDLKATESVEKGLGTKIFFECNNCNFQRWISSEQEKNKSFPINKTSVLATVVSGTGYEGMKQLCAGMNISCMSPITYIKLRRSLIGLIEEAAKDEMKKAGEMERQIAIEKGHVINGISWIEVEGDGGYGKRSYRSGKHDSLLCVGVIIGVETKKVLSVEVRQKFCLTCFKATKLNRKPRAHRCFKNWSYKKSSSSMETDCILKGFQKSVETHNLIYKTYIGDGDSATYKALLDNDVYGKYGVRVGRLYCYNHLFRNLCNKIVDASRSRINRGAVTGDILKFRTFIKKSAFRVRKTIIFHVNLRIKQDCSEQEKVKELQRDILNVVNHVFGQHKYCKTRGLNCSISKKEKNWIPVLKACRLYDTIEEAVRKISCFGKSLLRTVTTNASENYNSRVAKYIDGKHTNHAFTDSYHIRCLVASIQYNTGTVYATLNRYVEENFDIAIDVEAGNKAKVLRNRILSESKSKRKKTFAFADDEKDYGDNHQEPDVSKEVYDELVRNHFQQLEKDRDNREEIERRTIKQTDCDEWFEKRRKLITGSKFGPVCKARQSTKCAAKVRSILYPTELNLPQLTYGREKETNAIAELDKKMNVKVERAGLLIDIEKPYLAATLDGKIDEDGMIEIKSPYVAKNLTPLQAIKQIQIVREIFSREDINKLNRQHNYYYQVQGSLHISRRKYCLFVLYTPKGIHIVREEYDEEFWKMKMEPKLTRFYMECLLPEIVDSRIRRNMPIKEPDYIINALKEKKIRDDKKKSKLMKQGTNKEKSKSDKIDLTGVDNEIINKPEYIDNIDETHTQTDLKPVRSTLKKNSIIKKMKRELQQMSNLKRKSKGFAFDVDIKRQKSMSDDIPNHRKISKEPDSVMSNAECQSYIDICNSSININEVISNILNIDCQLDDADVQTFMNIVRKYVPHFEIHDVQHFAYLHLLKPPKKDKHLQIVGGNKYNHWICIYFDGIDLFIYDSLNRLQYERLHVQEKEYLQVRYSDIESDKIRFIPVTRQPDSSSCAIYAAAFVTDIVFGSDPSKTNFSKSAYIMRQHLAKIINETILFPFPTA